MPSCCVRPGAAGVAAGSVGSMPLARYFLYTGGVLLALLFLLDWYLPSPASEAARADVDRSTIRVHSLQRWPSAVAFDTSQPTIVPPAAMAAAAKTPPARPAVEPAKSPLDALAMAQPKEPPAFHAAPATARKRVVRRTKLARTPAPAPRVASSDMFGFGNPFAPHW